MPESVRLSESRESKKRSLSFAASDVLAAIAKVARGLDGAESAVLEIHDFSSTPKGIGRAARGAGVFADEEGVKLLRSAYPLVRQQAS
eukprot:7161491-Prymnesium_polylepis.1